MGIRFRSFPLVSVVALFAFVLFPVAASAGDKVDVCHMEGNGGYHLINISEKAFPKHVDHGDAVPGDPVPGMDGYVFGEGCEPVESIDHCPTY